MSAARSSSSLRADAVLVCLTAVWGASFIIVKGALGQVDTLSFLALRFTTGAAALTLVAGRKMRDGPSVRAGLVLGLFLFVGFALQTAGLRYTSATRSAFITGLSVLLVPFASILFWRRWPRPPAAFGALLSAVGLWLLARSAGADRTSLLGDALTLGCAIAFSFHIIFTSAYSPKVHVTAMVAVQLWTVALLAAAAVPFGHPHLEPGWAVWIAVLFGGLLANAFAISVQSWAQARTSAIRAALIFSLEPVFATAFAAAFTRERIQALELGGGAFILGGVLCGELGSALWDRRKARR